jgi:peptidoglycan/xylan/chitin deacetylase (PgdA/CDA1 family)
VHTKPALRSVYNAAKTAAGSTGLPGVVRRVVARRRVAILTYHRPTPARFEAHLRWLARRGAPIPIELLARALRERDASLLPAHPVLITIDDGHRDVAVLIPLIERYRVPVLVYLTAAIVGTRRRFWWEPVCEVGDDPQPLKRLPYAEFVETLRRKYRYEPEREHAERSALDWEEIRALRHTGLVAFGSHTLTHPILTRCPDEIARREIFESRALLEERLQSPVVHFAYPNGAHGAREIALVREAGYETARGTADGWVDPREGADPLSLKMIRAADDDNVAQLAYAMAGLDILRKRMTGGR